MTLKQIIKELKKGKEVLEKQKVIFQRLSDEAGLLGNTCEDAIYHIEDAINSLSEIGEE